MAHAPGPDFVALQVHDLDQSARFYTEQLGLRRAPQSPPGAVVFQTAPIPFAVRRPAPGMDLDAVERLGWGVVPGHANVYTGGRMNVVGGGHRWGIHWWPDESPRPHVS